jgi:CrcB protein
MEEIFLQVIFVALGGAVGAALRYGLGLLPWRGTFPLATLLTNVLGAVVIGFIAGMAARRGLSDNAVLFFKTGVCGGFTTFSTFSLEACTLLQRGQVWHAGTYILLSVALCLAGVTLGLYWAARVASC